jgi:hypothetical protein
MTTLEKFNELMESIVVDTHEWTFRERQLFGEIVRELTPVVKKEKVKKKEVVKKDKGKLGKEKK